MGSDRQGAGADAAVKKRTYFAHAQYPGKKSFYVGTIWAESEMEAAQQFPGLWSNISPHEPPAVQAFVPGVIWTEAAE